VVVHIGAVSGIAVTSWTSVNAYVYSFFGREAIQDFVVDVNECLQELSASPRVLGIVSSCEAAFSKIYRNSLSPSVEAFANVLLAFVDQVLNELVLGVAFDFAWSGVE
jgi:hypothetical protein